MSPSYAKHAQCFEKEGYFENAWAKFRQNRKQFLQLIRRFCRTRCKNVRMLKKSKDCDTA